MKARDRISRIVEKWLLTDPLLLATWTSHALIAAPRLQNIRVQRGRIEYNPQFIDQLSNSDLAATLRFEAMRILLKHPYQRRRSRPTVSYAASNVTLQEYLQTALPFPRAQELFDDPAYDKQYFELYYHALIEQMPPPQAPESGASQTDPDAQSPSNQDASENEPQPQSEEQQQGGESHSPSASGLSEQQPQPSSGNSVTQSNPLQIYADANHSGVENADQWDQDELFSDRIDDLVKQARDTHAWGTITGKLRERILANLRPPLDYRGVLRQFRTSILSQERRLTRMKPNRRYGFAYMGSRREFATRLLFAVDVSGSMDQDQLTQGFSIINHFFNYGVPQIDVIQFDTEITAAVMTLRRARRQVKLKGRGGTNFAPVLAYIDDHRHYDGVIIYTDGYAPCPTPPDNRRTRVLWLFVHKTNYERCYPTLKHLGRGAYLKPTAPSTTAAFR